MKKTVPILLLIILFASAAWYSFIKEPDPIHTAPPPSLVQSEPVEVQPEPGPVDDMMDQEPEILPDPLPLLADSDQEIALALAELTDPGPLATYMVKSQVISRIVASVDSLTSRQVPPLINPIRAVEGTLATASEGESTIMSADNYVRYTAYVTLLQGLDKDAVPGFYTRYYPLFQQAWEENGGEGAFNDRLLDVIDHLLATPDVEGDIYLVKPEAVYLYEDPELEALSAGQKTLLRMGPENAALVKAKLAEIKSLVEN